MFGSLSLLLLMTIGSDPGQMAAGEHECRVDVGGKERIYLVHVPESLEPNQPAPVVLVFHGFGADGATMARFCGMNTKADKEGFVAVYPYGTGSHLFRLFNGGGGRNEMTKGLPDDVQYVDRILDELPRILNVDARRIYATGFSNGAMMCYRLAIERSEKLAAIATVAGTMARGLGKPARPVPVIHFQGTEDPAFAIQGKGRGASSAFDVYSAEETIAFWVEQDRVLPEPIEWTKEDQFDDGTTVQRRTYRTASGRIRVVIYIIEGAGHTWPGQKPPWFLGNWTREISANDLIWDFFVEHPLEVE